MRENLLLLGLIITLIIASSDVIAAGIKESNNLSITYIQSKKLEGIDGNIAESIVDRCSNIYFVAFSSEDLLYKYYIDGSFIKIIIDNEKRSYSNVIADSNCNIYFISRLTQQGLYELYFLKRETTTATRINGINHNVDIIYLDNNDNVYIGTSQYGSYMINNGTTSAKKIEYLHKMADNNLFLVDKNNTVYFVNRVFPNDEICYLTEEEILKPNPTVKTINGITNSRAKYVNFMLSDNDNNIYIGTTGGLFKINANDQQVTTILTDAVDHGVIDTQNNIYYSSYGSSYPYSAHITTNSGITLKIKGLDNLAYIINDIQIDSNDNIYFVVIKNGIFILIFGETTATKIEGISSDVEVKKIKIDKSNNAYIITTDEYFRDSFYVLERDKDFPERISGISSFFKTIVFRDSNVYIGTGEGVYLVRIN